MKKTLSCSQYSHGLAQEGNTWTAHIQSLKIVIFVPGADDPLLPWVKDNRDKRVPLPLLL